MPSGRNTQWVSRLWRWKWEGRRGKPNNSFQRNSSTLALSACFHIIHTLDISWRWRKEAWQLTHIVVSALLGCGRTRFCYFDNIIFSLFSATHRKMYMDGLWQQRSRRSVREVWLNYFSYWHFTQLFYKKAQSWRLPRRHTETSPIDFLLLAKSKREMS